MKIINAIEQFFNPVKKEELALNQVDLCFVIDTTGSMGPFIDAARQHLLDTISLLGAESGIDLQVGLVEYRDHPPQELSFVTRVYPLTESAKDMQKVINKLKSEGGGDAPEAVYDGAHAACTQMKWRSHSCRFVLLVGDAPPHGFKSSALETASRRERNRYVNYGDSWENGCPCGLNAQSVTASAEIERITVHAICMSDSAVTIEAFTEIAIGTGGSCVQAKDAKDVVDKIRQMLAAEFKDLHFDAQVLETVQKLGDLEASEIANLLNCPRLQAASSIARLGKRGFLEV